LHIRQNRIALPAVAGLKQIIAGDRRNEEVPFFGAESAALVAIHAGSLRALGSDSVGLAGSTDRRTGAQYAVQINGLPRAVVRRSGGTRQRRRTQHQYQEAGCGEPQGAHCGGDPGSWLVGLGGVGGGRKGGGRGTARRGPGGGGGER